MFNDKYGLTASVLEGRKTMTRRFVPIVMNENDINWGIGNNGKKMITIEVLTWDGSITEDIYPQYQVGEVVAVAQNYKDVREGGYPVDSKGSAGETNKMFVKADLMPHHIRIDDVRVERLQDITDEDCMAEGIIEDYDCQGVQYSFGSNIGYCGQLPYDTPRLAFSALIDKVAGKGTWERNPWVFVYTFELID